MGRYVYIDKNSTKGRFGIGIDIFKVLAQQAFERVPGLVNVPVESGHRHKLHLNNSEIEIHHGVVYVELFINAKKSVDLDELKEQLKNEIDASFMMIAEQVPVEVKIKVENII